MRGLRALAAEVLAGRRLGREEALSLVNAPLNELAQAANALRHQVHGRLLDTCSIVNARSLACPQDCAFCAQSARNGSRGGHSWLDESALLEAALRAERAGVRRFSLVATGRRLSGVELERAESSLRLLRKKTRLRLCASLGLLDSAAFQRLKEAGLERAHLNLETSERFFPRICTTHRWSDKRLALEAARGAGLETCSGGILGMGETWEDRVDLALSLRDLGVHSVPLNVLDPIPGTPLEDRPPLALEEVRRAVALFRFVLPRAWIRLAGGRRLLADTGASCLHAGADALMTGDLLTTLGPSPVSDRAMAEREGWQWLGPDRDFDP